MTQPIGRTFAAMMLVLALANCTQRPTLDVALPPIDYGSKSLLLKPGMTEKQVTEILGQPNKAEVNTCGQRTAKPWSCKSLGYGNTFRGMSILLEPASVDVWVINSWHVYQ